LPSRNPRRLGFWKQQHPFVLRAIDNRQPPGDQVGTYDGGRITNSSEYHSLFLQFLIQERYSRRAANSGQDRVLNTYIQIEAGLVGC